MIELKTIKNLTKKLRKTIKKMTKLKLLLSLKKQKL
jgi:hypothetical protein